MSHCHLNYTYAERETHLEGEGVGDRVLGRQLYLNVRPKGRVQGWAQAFPSASGC